MLAATGAATLWASHYSLWLAIPCLYAYYFIYGFWVAIGHELQHKTVFGPGAERLSAFVYFIVQIFMWNSPRYARVSHRLHHRFTMVHGTDPETDWWPETISTKWLRRYLFDLISRVLVIGAVIQLLRDVKIHIERIAGKKDIMMREHCSDDDIRAIRIESAAILGIHVLVAGLGVWFQRWEPIVFMTLAWQIGNAFEALWHQTEHIGRLNNVRDQRYATRSIRVNPLVRLIYWGLDDHVDHHMFPNVPSRNLPKLHSVLHTEANLAKPRGVIGCWLEMFAIAHEKDQRPNNEYEPVDRTAEGNETEKTQLSQSSFFTAPSSDTNAT